MTQHNALSVHTNIFVPFSILLLQNPMMLLALHQMQKVKQTRMVPVSQVTTGVVCALSILSCMRSESAEDSSLVVCHI